MSLFVWSIAAALAMDALAVAAALSAATGGLTPRSLVRLAGHFGLFQGLMAALGWAAGATLETWIATWDHWLAAVLLAAVGVRMLVEAFEKDAPAARRPDPTRGWSLVGLSIATSIDALGAGVGLGAMSLPLWAPAAAIAVTAALLTAVGGLAGGYVGARFGRWAVAIGGAVLLVVAVSIPVQHLADAAPDRPAGRHGRKVEDRRPATRDITHSISRAICPHRSS
jgi:putative Mn2+ efflux pump MntP